MKLRHEVTKDKDVAKLQSRLADLLDLIPFGEGQAVDVTFFPSNFPLSIPYKLDRPPTHLVGPTYLRNITPGGAQPTAGVWIDWLPDGGTIRIKNVTGLTAANQYTMRFLVFA